MYLGKIHNIIKERTKTLVFKNFSALMILQLGNTVLALIIMPYLINALGISKYGLYSFAFAISMYLVIVTDYGFGFTGVKLISVNRNNLNKVSGIFHSIQIIKIIILLILLVIYSLAILFIETLSENKELFFLSFGILIGQTIIPIWFFQGMEKMKYITVINLSIRLISLILILVFVKQPEDINLAIASQAFGFLFAGVLSVFIAYAKFDLKPSFPKKTDVFHLISSSKDMFFSSLSLSLYKNFNLIFLGFLSTNTEVGIYSAAEKIIKAAHSLTAPLSQAIYPNMSLKFSELKTNESVSKLLKLSKYYTVPLLGIISLLLLFEDFFIRFLGISDSGFSRVFIVLTPVIFLGSLNYLFGIIGLVNLNKEKNFNKATLTGAAVNLTLCWLLSENYGATGSAIALVIAEFTVLLLVIYFLFKIKNRKN
jgi:PST family polysaccharide transporter